MEQSYQNYKNVLQAKIKNLLDDYTTQIPVPQPTPALSAPSHDIIPSYNLKSPVVPVVPVVPVAPVVIATSVPSSKSSSISESASPWSVYDILIWVIIFVMIALFGVIIYYCIQMCNGCCNDSDNDK